MKDYDKALAASDRALLHVHGPRRLTVLSARADIFIGKGDPKAAREMIVAAIEYAKALPEGQRSERRIATLELMLSVSSGSLWFNRDLVGGRRPAVIRI